MFDLLNPDQANSIYFGGQEDSVPRECCEWVACEGKKKKKKCCKKYKKSKPCKSCPKH